MIEDVKAEIRKFYERDLDQIKKLEKTAFIDYPWTDEDFIIFLRKQGKGHQIFVADWRENIIGFMLVIKKQWSYEIVSIAVSPEFRRFGIATQLIDSIKSTLVPYTREDIYTTVMQNNRDALDFFVEQGFVALELEHNCHGEMENVGCYKMKYEMAEMPLKEEYANR